MVHVLLPSKLDFRRKKFRKKICFFFKFKKKIQIENLFHCRCAREVGVDRLIHLSAMNVTPDPIPKVYKGGSKWLKSKYWGEQAVMEEFPNATIIRPADMYGREDHFFWYYSHIWRHQWHWMPLWEKGEKTVKAPVFGGDVAQAIVNAAKDPESAGKIYQGVGPQRYLLSEIVDYMHRVMQKDEKDWGYKRYDMKYDPTFWLRTYLTDKFQISHPIGELHRERVEREYIDDVILDGVPTLEDLGVTPSLIEENVSDIIVFFFHLFQIEKWTKYRNQIFFFI